MLLRRRGHLSFLVALLSLSATVALSACGSVPAPLTQTLVCGTAPLNTTAAIRNLFGRFHNAAWSGADGTEGVGLPDGRTLLTFGDTFQDPHGLNANGSRPANYRIRHNSMMVIGSKCLGALMPQDDSEPFASNPDGSYYWPGQPAVERRPGNAAGDRILIPAARIKTVAPGDMFGFQTVGTDLFVFDLVPGRSPVLETKYAMPSLVASRNIVFGSGAFINDGNWLYLFGGRHDPAATFASDVYLARVPLAHLDSLPSYQYLTGRVDGTNEWSTSAGAAAPLATPTAGSGPSGGNDVVLVPGGIGWIGNSDEFGGPGIQAWTSPSLTQVPYSRSGLLLPAASTSAYYVYGGAAHPEHALADGKELVTWSRNPIDQADLVGNGNSYMPQIGEISRVGAAPGPAPAPVAPQATMLPRVQTPTHPAVRGLVRLAPR